MLHGVFIKLPWGSREASIALSLNPLVLYIYTCVHIYIDMRSWFHGAFMMLSWSSVAPPWCFHGTSMVLSWTYMVLGTFIVLPWFLHGTFMDSHGVPIPVLASVPVAPLVVVLGRHGAAALLILLRLAGVMADDAIGARC